MLLQGKKLTKLYLQGECRIYGANEADFVAEEGEFVVICGKSGSGKTTLLHLLSGMDRPTSGTVLLDGTDLYALSDEERAAFRRRSIGCVFQDYQLMPALNARENILLPVLLDRRRPDEAQLLELCALLGITDRLQHLPSALSGGQQQRVAVARALINRPRILFADEPTGNLDRASAGELFALLRQSSQRFRQTIVMVTHDESLAGQADRLYRMEDGRLTQIK